MIQPCRSSLTPGSTLMITLLLPASATTCAILEVMFSSSTSAPSISTFPSYRTQTAISGPPGSNFGGITLCTFGCTHSRTYVLSTGPPSYLPSPDNHKYPMPNMLKHKYPRPNTLNPNQNAR